MNYSREVPGRSANHTRNPAARHPAMLPAFIVMTLASLGMNGFIVFYRFRSNVAPQPAPPTPTLRPTPIPKASLVEPVHTAPVHKPTLRPTLAPTAKAKGLIPDNFLPLAKAPIPSVSHNLTTNTSTAPETNKITAPARVQAQTGKKSTPIRVQKAHTRGSHVTCSTLPGKSDSWIEALAKTAGKNAFENSKSKDYGERNWWIHTPDKREWWANSRGCNCSDPNAQSEPPRCKMKRPEGRQVPETLCPTSRDRILLLSFFTRKSHGKQWKTNNPLLGVKNRMCYAAARKYNYIVEVMDDSKIKTAVQFYKLYTVQHYLALTDWLVWLDYDLIVKNPHNWYEQYFEDGIAQQARAPYVSGYPRSTANCAQTAPSMWKRSQGYGKRRESAGANCCLACNPR